MLRHYGMTMEGDEYMVWCTRPRLTKDFTWAGCEMERIGSGRCSRNDDIHELIHWINEVHCWSRIKHAPSVEKDLKRTIEEHHKQNGGSRSSDIGRDSEDEPDSEGESDPENEPDSEDEPDADFAKRVLEPRSIKILDTYQFLDTPYGHFGIEVPETRHVAAIDPTKKLPESSIWIDASDTFVKRVAKRYTDMLSRNLCKAEFATFAKENLLKRDDFVDDKETDIREWRAERLVELVAKPEPKHTWAAPPIIEGLESANLSSSSEYSFDVRPDCSYWLGLKAFNPEHQSEVHRLIPTIHREFISPYFTIEFKRDLDAEVVVKNQVAAASSLALYNRFRLREKRPSVMQKPWTKEDLIMDIKHYGLTMQRSHTEIWCITPTLSEVDRWAGCEMKLIGSGYCNKSYNVRRFIDWINEIHYWGLTVHGPSCQNDAKYILSKKCKGFTPSEIGVEVRGNDKELRNSGTHSKGQG